MTAPPFKEVNDPFFHLETNFLDANQASDEWNVLEIQMLKRSFSKV
jgi:hypothetical protein